MKTIGIKLADGTFYPVIKEGSSEEVVLNLTTANNNQTKIMVDLYRSKTDSMDDAEYVDSLQIENLVEHPNGEPDISFTVSLDENNQLTAKIVDPETGAQSNSTITLVSRTQEQRLVTDEYNISETQEDSQEEAPVEETPEEEAPAEETPEDKEAIEAAAIAAMASGAAIMPDEEIVTEEEPVFEETAVEEPNPSVSSQFVEDDLSAFGGEASNDKQQDSLENFFDSVPESSELPTMDGSAFDMPDETFDETEMPDMSDMSFEMPEETPVTEESSGLDSFEIPEDTSETFEMPSEETPETGDFEITEENSGFGDMDLNLDDSFPESNSAPSDDFASTDDFPPSDNFAPSDDFPPASGGISFTGLYDKETEYGDSSNSNEKSKTPAIICTIIIVLLLIAAALLLFVLPTKLNILNKNKTEKPVVENTAEKIEVQTPAPIPELESIPAAKEDEVIIIEKAEEVVPLPPPVAEEKPKDIIYKIKWGDTLWDIADTYYKNPWRYKYIARFNGIKDPDYIISGTLITIPAE